VVDINAILAKHQARAANKAKSAQERAESSAKFKLEQAQKRRAQAEKKQRKRRNKTGVALAEAFIEEIAPAYVALMQRSDADKLKNLRIILKPHRSDDGRFSAHIEGADASRRFPGGTLTNMASKHGTDDEPGWAVERLMRKLNAEGGDVKFNSRADCLEEILMLRQQLKAAQARIAKLEAAQPKAPDPVEAFDVEHDNSNNNSNNDGTEEATSAS